MNPDPNVYIVPESYCPRCFHKFDRASGLALHTTGEGPRPGDLTLCIACGQLLTFTPELDVRLPSPDEFERLASDPTMTHMVESFRMAMAIVNRRN